MRPGKTGKTHGPLAEMTPVFAPHEYRGPYVSEYDGVQGKTCGHYAHRSVGNVVVRARITTT
jgi:hypothetical protein